jgi:integrase
VKGSVYKRCPCPVDRDSRGNRKACRIDHGSWEYVADAGRAADGKRRQVRKAGFATKRAAEEALTELLDDLRTGEYAHDERQTVGEYLAAWIEVKVANGLRATTERSYRQHIRDHLVPQLGRLRLRDLRPGHVEAMLRTVKAGPTTRRRVHATLRSALSDAQRRQLIPYNPADTKRVTLPKATRPKVQVWQPAELGRFLDAIGQHRLGALYELDALTGLRRGELLGLRWSDVDLEAGRLTVRQQVVQLSRPVEEIEPCALCGAKHRGILFGRPKTTSGEDRLVDLDDGSVGVLLAHRLAQDAERGEWGSAYADHGLVFAREDGNPLAPDQVTKQFRALAVEHGLPPQKLHGLRHGMASLQLAAGVDIAVVSKTLGHGSISITADTYGHLLGGVGKDAARRAAGLVPRGRREQIVSTTDPDNESAGPRSREPADERSAPPGTRTPNPRIKSPLLCQLS